MFTNLPIWIIYMLFAITMLPVVAFCFVSVGVLLLQVFRHIQKKEPLL